LRRAEAAKDFLVSLGVNPAMISVHGFGSDALRNNADPTAAENRRIEIARDLGR
jgi:outer membrane protein OmpA-like peptidoglycan-associated protein